MTHKIITITLYDADGNQANQKRYAVEPNAPTVACDWGSGDVPCQSDQQWVLWVWQRIAGRGYVASLSGSGQWSNRGDHGTYCGVGDTAVNALLNAWPGDDYDDPPAALLSACRRYDSEVTPPVVQ